MGLIGNYSVLNKNPGRAFGGPTVSDSRGQWNKSGATRGRYVGEAAFTAKDSHPVGYRPPYQIVIAIKNGGMGSYDRATGVGTFTAGIAGGVNGEAALSGTGTLAGAGALVVSAFASLTGSGTITSATLIGLLLATADLSGSGTVTAATMFASGAMAGSLAGVGTLAGTRYAVGYMEADITPYSTLSPESLASSVWGAVAVQNNTVGTMGEKLNDAGAAGDPWATDTSGYTTPGTFGYLVQKLLTVAKFLGLK